MTAPIKGSQTVHVSGPGGAEITMVVDVWFSAPLPDVMPAVADDVIKRGLQDAVTRIVEQARRAK